MTTTTENTLPVAAVERTKPKPRRPREGRINWWGTALIAVCSLTILVPLYYAVVVSLKTPDQLNGGTGLELPTSLNWQNFVDAWNLTNFPQALVNTALITVGAVVLTLLTSSMVSYAIARNLHHPFFK